MNENHHNENINENILSAIESGKVKMLPKWRFLALSALYVSSAILALLGILFIFSLIIFSLHLNGAWFVGGFGVRGFTVFLQRIPWLMTLLGVIFIIILQILVRHFSYAYSKPLFYSAGIIIIVSLLGSILIAQTDFHKSMFVNLQRQHGPFNNFIYQNYSNGEQENINIGEVTNINHEGFLLLTRENENLVVFISPQTQLPPNTQIFTRDFVVVFGPRQNNTISALGIKKITREPFMNMRMRGMK